MPKNDNLGNDLGLPNVPEPSDEELDEQAQKMLAMLLGAEQARRPRKVRADSSFAHQRAHYSTMGTFSFEGDTPDEPENVVAVACNDWKNAIKHRDERAADEAAHYLYTLLQPMAHRPTIAEALREFRFSDALSLVNLPPLSRVLAHVMTHIL